MKFVNAKYEIWDVKECNAKNIIETIEKAAKVCYKSESNIKEGSALPFVKNLIKRGHTSCLEHGSIYLKFNIQNIMNKKDDISLFLLKCYEYCDKEKGFENSKCLGIKEKNNNIFKIYTNARFIYEKCPKLFWNIILEKNIPNYIELFTPNENDPYRRQTVTFTADQRITEEFIRHRIASPNKESTRYCVYSSEKYNKELTFIIPLKAKEIIKENDVLTSEYIGGSIKWFVNNEKIIKNKDIENLLNLYKKTETTYNDLVNEYKWKGEEARIVLNLGVKADLVLTNSLIDWCYGRKEPIDDYIADINAGEVQGKRIKGFFGLRTDIAAHPQARELAIPLMEEFKKRKWLIEENK